MGNHRYLWDIPSFTIKGEATKFSETVKDRIDRVRAMPDFIEYKVLTDKFDVCVEFLFDDSIGNILRRVYIALYGGFMDNKRVITRNLAPAYASAVEVKNWRLCLDDRQKKELELANLYKEQFNHGTTGHNQLILIAELAQILDFIETNYVLGINPETNPGASSE